MSTRLPAPPAWMHILACWQGVAHVLVRQSLVLGETFRSLYACRIIPSPG
jgi:hypothetical protein